MRFSVWRLSVFIAAAIWPLYWLYEAWSFALGPDPGKVLVDRLGLGTLILLLLTLSMTPMQRLTGWPGWIAVRRQLGLWCFFYVALHLCAYLIFVLGLDWSQLGVELLKRPYIIVGSLGFVCLLALAVTSNRYSQRRLGIRWKKLHRLAYVVLGLGLPLARFFPYTSVITNADSADRSESAVDDSEPITMMKKSPTANGGK